MDTPRPHSPANDSTDWRTRLRALPVLTGELPAFDPDSVSDDPQTLFGAWLDAAIEDGVRAPHAATLSTSDGAGDVSARTLILKDIDERGWWFASRSDGRKSRDLAADPRAAMTFLWREHGRQVRVTGTVVDAGRAAADADFLARPAHSRAAAVIGTQSAPMPSRADYLRAFEDAKDAAAAHPDRTSPVWTAYVLVPLTVEFWASTPTSGPVRLSYRRDGVTEPWCRGLLWP